MGMSGCNSKHAFGLSACCALIHANKPEIPDNSFTKSLCGAVTDLPIRLALEETQTCPAMSARRRSSNIMICVILHTPQLSLDTTRLHLKTSHNTTHILTKYRHNLGIMLYPLAWLQKQGPHLLITLIAVLSV